MQNVSCSETVTPSYAPISGGTGDKVFDPQRAEEDKSTSIIILVSIGGGVLLIFTIVWICMCVRNKKEAANTNKVEVLNKQIDDRGPESFANRDMSSSVAPSDLRRVEAMNSDAELANSHSDTQIVMQSESNNNAPAVAASLMVQ